MSSAIVIGAGPAGLTSAYELQKHGICSTALEADQVVGGISRTVSHRGYRFAGKGHFVKGGFLYHNMPGTGVLLLGDVDYNGDHFRRMRRGRLTSVSSSESAKIPNNVLAGLRLRNLRDLAVGSFARAGAVARMVAPRRFVDIYGDDRTANRPLR